LNGLKSTITALKIEQAFFHDFSSAADWIMKGNEKGMIR
jgi:hypothetical protein